MQLPASGKSELGRKCLQGPRVQTADATRIPSKSAQIAGSEQGVPENANHQKWKMKSGPCRTKAKPSKCNQYTNLLANGGCVGPAQRGGLSNISGSPAWSGSNHELQHIDHCAHGLRTCHWQCGWGITMPLTPFKLSSERPVSSTWSPTRMHSFDLSAIAMPWRQVGHRGCKGGLQPDHHSTKAHRNGQNEGTWLLYRLPVHTGRLEASQNNLFTSSICRLLDLWQDKIVVANVMLHSSQAGRIPINLQIFQACLLRKHLHSVFQQLIIKAPFLGAHLHHPGTGRSPLCCANMRFSRRARSRLRYLIWKGQVTSQTNLHARAIRRNVTRPVPRLRAVTAEKSTTWAWHALMQGHCEMKWHPCLPHKPMP